MNLEAVNRLIGKPWVYLENDCWHVVKEASRLVFGVEIVDNISFSSKPAKGATANIINTQTARPCWIKTDTPSSGDVFVFSDRGGNPVHVGIMIEKNNILHCMGGEGVKNGRTRYDNINVIRLIYSNYEAYTYADNDS